MSKSTEGFKYKRLRRRALRLVLLFKTVTGHVANKPDQIGLVAADNRTLANHRYKFRAMGHHHLGFAIHLRSEQWV